MQALYPLLNHSYLSNHLFYRVRLSPLLFVPLCPMYLLLLFLPLWKSFHNPFIKFIYCSHIITSSPIIIDRCLLLTTERCVIHSSSVGSYRSQYITISASFTDAFLPSSPHSTSIHRLCYRRCLIAGTFLSEAIIATFLCLSKR